MSDDDETQPVSGSRWQQQPDQPSSPPPPAQPPAQPAAPPAAMPAAVPAYAAAPPPARGRLSLAGGAVAVALVAGTAGFAGGVPEGEAAGTGDQGDPDRATGEQQPAAVAGRCGRGGVRRDGRRRRSGRGGRGRRGGAAGVPGSAGCSQREPLTGWVSSSLMGTASATGAERSGWGRL